MKETVHCRLRDAQIAKRSGYSLAQTLYGFPLDIALNGELGAGKTTFLSGFGEALGIREPLTSPTYALEQRYAMSSGAPFVHMDLYRLTPIAARELLVASEHHEGIRCVEWANIAPDHPMHISIALEDVREGRNLTVVFDDVDIPTAKHIDDWHRAMMQMDHIRRHCHVVAEVSRQCAKHILARGELVRLEALTAAAELHDLLRFLDFRPGGHTSVPTAQQQRRWETLRTRYEGHHHETACTAFLEEQGFPAIAAIVASHGFNPEAPPRDTIEKKILYYADKRVMVDQVVSLDERFADFSNRFTGGKSTPINEERLQFCKNLERELFPEGAPL